MMNNRIQSAQKAQEAHYLNLKRNLERRLEVARAKGDEKLIRQLEAEMKYIG
jgi:hypothetical protein